MRITNASDPVPPRPRVIVLYGAPGTGKTSLAFTAPKPLLIDFDMGAHRARRRGPGSIATPDNWTDLARFFASGKNIAGYESIVLDTVGALLDDFLAPAIMAERASYRRGDSLSQQGWGELAGRFARFFRHLRGTGRHIIILAHEKADEEMGYRPDVKGSSLPALCREADMIGRLTVGEGGRREIKFSPDPSAYGKNVLGPDFDSVAVDPEDGELVADIIRQIDLHFGATTGPADDATTEEPTKADATTGKGNRADATTRQADKAEDTNRQAEEIREQKHHDADLAEWMDYLDSCESPADFEAFARQAKGAPDEIKDRVRKAFLKALEANQLRLRGGKIVPVEFDKL